MDIQKNQGKGQEKGKIHVREEIMDRVRTLENPPRERAWTPQMA